MEQLIFALCLKERVVGSYSISTEECAATPKVSLAQEFMKKKLFSVAGAMSLEEEGLRYFLILNTRWGLTAI